jgi:hypothetical protein
MAQAEVHAGQVTADDRVFLKRFEDCTLPETEWTHIAHIRVAWLCLAQDPPDRALERIRVGILRYNTEVLLRRHKYHETVTVAFARIVSDRMRALQTWQQFAEGIDDILDPETPILMNYYSGERLFSDEARQHFVEPDIRQLPVFRVF